MRCAGIFTGSSTFWSGRCCARSLPIRWLSSPGTVASVSTLPGYYRRTYQRIAKTLKKLNCGLLLIRGNHDAPEFFQRERIVFPRMRTLPDYSVIRFKDHTILCIGGATHRHGCYPYRPLVLLPHDQKRNRDVDGLRSESGKGYR